MNRQCRTICCPECGSRKLKKVKVTGHFKEGNPDFPVRQIECATYKWKCKKCQKTFEDTVMI